MYRLVNIFRTKLTWYLIGCVILSGLLAFGSGFLIVYFGRTFIDNQYDDEGTNREFQIRYMDDLQQYVSDNKITQSNISAVSGWTENNSYVYLAIYQNNKLIFNSDYAYYDTETLEETVEEEEITLLDEDYLYRLNLADGTMASVDMFCYDYWKYYYYVWAIGVGFGIFLFILVLMKLLQQKMRYIHDIERELRILEGGNLEYPITIKGQDEISGLARGVEQMRLSIIENMQKEQKMQQANKDLVTSMSHDLRTPLTTLTGYLEILSMDHAKSEEERKRYLELSLAKSREIKELSDQLFEYFLIYGENTKRLEVEGVPAYALVSDLIENQFLFLEEVGFQLSTNVSLDEASGNCMVNPQYMQRVLNNIMSNIEKYADENNPIVIQAYVEENQLHISVENTIKKNLDVHESTKIGLITCDRIMKLHHGLFIKEETEEQFKVELLIPMEQVKK